MNRHLSSPLGFGVIEAPQFPICLPTEMDLVSPKPTSGALRQGPLCTHLEGCLSGHLPLWSSSHSCPDFSSLPHVPRVIDPWVQDSFLATGGSCHLCLGLKECPHFKIQDGHWVKVASNWEPSALLAAVGFKDQWLFSSPHFPRSRASS